MLAAQHPRNLSLRGFAKGNFSKPLERLKEVPLGAGEIRAEEQTRTPCTATSLANPGSAKFVRAVGFEKFPKRQAGVVLMMALIMLVALTLTGIALIRSVDTTNIIAGNLAFKESATNYGDFGVETALAWLESRNAGGQLFVAPTDSNTGYSPSRSDPAPGQSWDAFWAINANLVVTLAPDVSTGNTVAYMIHRLCNTAGDPVAPGVGCSVLPSSGSSAGSSKGEGEIDLLYNSQVYYRITTRVTGPRNTVSYIQSIVAL